MVYSPEGTCPSQGQAGIGSVRGYWYDQQNYVEATVL
jgi:hypothetical protein